MTIDPLGGTGPAPGSPQAKLMKTARDLESVFYGQLFQAMRAAVPEGGIFQKSNGEQMFTSMLDDEVSRLASAQSGDRGLAGALYRQLSKQLPGGSTAATPTASVTALPGANE